MVLLARTTPLDQVKKKSQGLSVFLVDLKEAIGRAWRSGRSATWSTTRPTRCSSTARGPAREPARRAGSWPQDHPLRAQRRAHPHRRRNASVTPGGSSRRRLPTRRTRVVFGRPIGQNQGVQFPIARAYANTRAADSMRYVAAALHDAGQPNGAKPTWRSCLCADASWRQPMPACRHMGVRLRREYDVERKFRETRLYQVRADLDEPDPVACGRACARPAALLLRRAMASPLARMSNALAEPPMSAAARLADEGAALGAFRACAGSAVARRSALRPRASR